MKELFDKKIRSVLLGFGIVTFLFIAASFVANAYDDQIREFVQAGGYFGMAAYVLIMILSVVIAPVSALPLMPIASGAWGWFMAGALSIVGWVIGSQIAFWIARRFGRPFVLKMVSKETLETMKRKFSQTNLFWTVVLLRMMLPVDALSYALGLFSTMSNLSYFWATLIGVTPLALVFAYAGTLPLRFQIMVTVGALIVIIFFMKRK